MVDVPADRVVLPRPTLAWRTLAVLALLGFVSLAAVSDQPAADRDQRRACGPFILGQSLLGGCDWLE